MDGSIRRTVINQKLSNSKSPISASEFAREFGVSRQVVVGDIALLRAQGQNIIATSKGYIIDTNDGRIPFVVAVSHDSSRTQEELNLLISLDAYIVDVIVEHPAYGEISGKLNIKTYDDIEAFMNVSSNPLSQLTNGIHLHTILCKDENHFLEVRSALEINGFLYDNE